MHNFQPKFPNTLKCPDTNPNPRLPPPQLYTTNILFNKTVSIP